MILFAGALFFIPLQRFLWTIGTRFLYVVEDFHGSVAEYFDWLFTTIWIAFFTSLGVAAAYAFNDDLPIAAAAPSKKKT